MKLTTIIVLVFSFTQCKTLQFDEKAPFKITEASYKNWVGGQPGVHGVNVFINYTSAKTVAFDSIYFQNKGARLELKETKGSTSIVGYFNTSNVKNKFDLILHKDGKKEVGNQAPKVKIPFVLKDNEAVISYKEKGIVKYYKVSNLKKSASDYYP